MTVKKKVAPSISSFIDKGADVKGKKHKGFKNILVRMPIAILDELDEFIEKKPWVINRTQWIIEAIHQKLKSDSNEEKENDGARN